MQWLNEIKNAMGISLTAPSGAETALQTRYNVPALVVGQMYFLERNRNLPPYQQKI